MRHTGSMKTLLIGASLLAAGGLLAAAPAAAQSVGRVVAFGDSYADNGNAFRLAGIPNPTVYPTGRFSGGTNFVDTLSQYFAVPQLNYAIGGAQAGSTNVTPGLPGFTQQYNGSITTAAYASLSATATFAPGDLLAVSIGGNDARAYRLGGGTLAGVNAAAAITAAQAKTGLDVLVARGARQIVFLAGDVGTLPEAIGQANAAIGSAYSQVFNAQTRTTLAGYAANGVVVTYLDTTAIAAQIRAAGLARYGLVDITNLCGGSAAAAAACVASPALQSQYLFYVDGVHLSSAGFTILGKYAINQIQAPLGFRQHADLVQRDSVAFGRALNARLDLARGASTDERRLALFGGFTASAGTRVADASGAGYESRSKGALLGGEVRMDALTLGVAGSYTRPTATGNSGTHTKAKGYHVGAFAGYQAGPIFAQGYASYNRYDLALSRTGVLDPLTAAPKARTIGAGGRIGYLMPAGRFSLGPVAGVDYARTRLNGWTETGDLAAALIVSRQRTTTLVGNLGAEVRGHLADESVAPYLRLTAEREFAGDARLISYANTSSAGIVNRFVVPRSQRNVYPAVAGGVRVGIVPGLDLDLDGKIRFGRDMGREANLFAGLRASF